MEALRIYHILKVLSSTNDAYGPKFAGMFEENGQVYSFTQVCFKNDYFYKVFRSSSWKLFLAMKKIRKILAWKEVCPETDKNTNS